MGILWFLPGVSRFIFLSRLGFGHGYYSLDASAALAFEERLYATVRFHSETTPPCLYIAYISKLFSGFDTSIRSFNLSKASCFDDSGGFYIRLLLLFFGIAAFIRSLPHMIPRILAYLHREGDT